MAYCTSTNIKRYLGEHRYDMLLDEYSDDATEKAEVVAQMIEMADSMIDASARIVPAAIPLTAPIKWAI